MREHIIYGLRTYIHILGSSALLSLLFYGLECLAPAEKRQPPRRMFFNLAYYPLILGWILVLQIPFAPAYSYIVSRVGGGLWPKLMGQPDGAIAQISVTLVFAVVWDVWQYWVHRWQHSSSFLWETHKFHHSETALNFSGQARQHALNYVLFMVLYMPVLCLFGSLTPHPVAMFVMFQLWGFINHANIRLDIRHLMPIIAGPQWHRIHHSVFPEHHDKNFAVFFPFIDMLFGTYHRPSRGEYPPTGFPDYVESDIRAATISPLLGWKRIVESAAPSLSPSNVRAGSR